MRYHKIPDETIQRLPVYLRELTVLAEQQTDNISSGELADYLDINHWQIRKDFSYFGYFGKPGIGYKIATLTKEIRKILKLNIVHKTALIGAGNLGSAVLMYPGFDRYGFEITAIFDNDPKKIGRKIGHLEVENAAKLKTLKKRGIDLAILAVPVGCAQEVTDELVKAGVHGILGFASCHLTVPKKVKIITIDIAMDLARLPYYLLAS